MSQDHGEKELVLGNKQLLGIFFVGTLLCGVFFAMGYVVGGNSTKLNPGSSEATPAQETEGRREEPPVTRDVPAAPVAATSATGDAGILPAVEPRVADNPAAAGSQPPPTAVPAQSVPVSTKPAASVPPANRAALFTDSAAGAVSLSMPDPAARYLQVGALELTKAQDLVRTLRQGAYPAILAKGPTPEKYRVLVGPYSTVQAEAEAKQTLKKKGFDDIFPYKQ